jgi:hypothetical protein
VLTSGTRLGPYEVLDSLGAGGMGAVYSARDTRLDRRVALKLVLDAFVADPERTSRLEHEAKTLAALNHPNIATLHGIEQVAGRHFLVMELVAGETLAERMARHPDGVPPQEALPIARQIVDALEAAHERGIVHRDLKPANIKVTPDDVVKVLDFGLAKAVETASVSTVGDLMNSPTFTSVGTELGVVLGTAAYMSPEQARGKPIDKRADIWAFGVVLFEMLSGGRLFTGDTASDTIAAVLTREPDFSVLPPAVPQRVRMLLRRCLERDPRKRLRDIGDARIELEQLSAPSATTEIGPARVRRSRAATWMAAALGLGLVVVFAALWKVRENRPAAPVITFDVAPPRGTTLQLSSRPAVAISPDGATIAIVAASQGQSHLYVRKRGEVEIHEIPNTAAASDPAFSPDGQWIAFVTDSEVVKISVDGRTRVSLAAVVDPRGLTWLDNQTIVASREVAVGLDAIPAAGGPLHQITSLDRQRNERTHRWPAAVPGGKAVLFTVGTDSNPDDYSQAGIEAVVVATGERKRVLEQASSARVTADGQLLFSRNGVLYLAPFDAERLALTGTPAAVLAGVEGDGTTGAGHFSISADRTLAYVPGLGASGQRRLAWADRKGAYTPIDLAPAVFNEPAISPDGSRIAVVVGTVGHADVWIYDIERKLFSRLTFEEQAATPRWTPDGQSIHYMTIDPKTLQSTLRRRRVDGSGQPAVLGTVPGRAYLGFVDAAERWGIVTTVAPARANNSDILRIPLKPAGEPQPFVATAALEFAPEISPDARWVAYVSASTGVQEVWVREMNGSGQYQISTLGGLCPRWSADGRELFFRRGDVQMAVDIETTPRFRAGQERALFTGVFNWRTEGGINYAVDNKTDRFLVILPPSSADPEAKPTVRVIANWK